MAAPDIFARFSPVTTKPAPPPTVPTLAAPVVAPDENDIFARFSPAGTAMPAQTPQVPQAPQDSSPDIFAQYTPSAPAQPKPYNPDTESFDPAMWEKVQGMKRGTLEHPSENYQTISDIGSQFGFLGVHGYETTGHNPNGAHPTGDAVDFRTRDKSWEDGNAFIKQMRALGLTVIDERKKPGQPHIHVQVPKGGVFRQNFQEFAQPQEAAPQQSSDTSNALTSPVLDALGIQPAPAPAIKAQAHQYPAPAGPQDFNPSTYDITQSPAYVKNFPSDRQPPHARAMPPESPAGGYKYDPSGLYDIGAKKTKGTNAQTGSLGGSATGTHLTPELEARDRATIQGIIKTALEGGPLERYGAPPENPKTVADQVHRGALDFVEGAVNPFTALDIAKAPVETTKGLVRGGVQSLNPWSDMPLSQRVTTWLTIATLGKAGIEGVRNLPEPIKAPALKAYEALQRGSRKGAVTAVAETGLPRDVASAVVDAAQAHLNVTPAPEASLEPKATERGVQPVERPALEDKEAPNVGANGKFTITNHHLDNAHGENIYQTVARTPDGKAVGILDYSVPNNDLAIVIKHVEVAPEFQRQGIATQLYDKTLAEHPGFRLETMGTRTVAGDAFRTAYDARNAPIPQANVVPPTSPPFSEAPKPEFPPATSEPPAPLPIEKPLAEAGIRHADTESARAQAQLEPYIKQGQKVEDIWNAASAIHGDQVLSKIAKGQTSINSAEQASLWKLSIETEKALKQAELIGDHKAADALLAKKLDTYNALDKLGGSEAGRTLGLRQFIAQGLDSESAIVRRWRNAKGADLTPEEFAKARETAQNIEKAKTNVEATDIKAAKDAAQAELDKSSSKPTNGKTAKATNKIFTDDRLKAAVEVWKNASKERAGRASAEVLPGASLAADLLTDPALRGALKDIVGYHIEKGIRSIPVLVQRVRDALGENVPVQAVRAVIDDVTQEFNDAGIGKETKKAKISGRPSITLDADADVTPAETIKHNDTIKAITKEIKDSEPAKDIQADIEAKPAKDRSDIKAWLGQEIRKGETDAQVLADHAKRLDPSLKESDAHTLVAEVAKGGRATKTGMAFKGNGTPPVKTPEQLAAIDTLQKLRDSVAKQEDKYGGNKFWRGVIETRKASVLSDMLGTNLKLSSAGVTQTAVAPLEELVSVIPKTLFKKSLGSAEVETGFNPKAEGKAAAAFASAYPKLIKGFATGKGQGFLNALHELELTYGDPKSSQFGGPLTKFFYEQHKVMKNPLERSAFARTYAKLADSAAKAGKDLTDPDMVGEIGRKAYEQSRQAIFMNDNAISKAWSVAMGSLERSTAPELAVAGRFLAPIVKVPVNIAGRFLEYSYGLEYGASKHIAGIIKKGREGIPAADADRILRAYKRGGVGAGLLALGYYGLSPVQLQGQEKDKAPGALQPGQMTLQAPGFKYVLSPFWSHILGHAPALSPIAIGATARQYEDGGMSAGAAWLKAMTIGTAKEGAAMPMMQTLQDLRDMGQDRTSHPGAMIGKAVIPQMLQGYKRFEESGNRGPAVHSKDAAQDFLDQARPVSQPKWQTEAGRLQVMLPKDAPFKEKQDDGSFERAESNTEFESRLKMETQEHDQSLNALVESQAYQNASDKARRMMMKEELASVRRRYPNPGAAAAKMRGAMKAELMRG